MKQYCNLNPRGPRTLPAAGSADELSPAINPVWRIILFPSSGQTLSVMKWPRVPPGSPVPSRPSDSAWSQGWGVWGARREVLGGCRRLQCGFNPTQPLLGSSDFVTSLPTRRGVAPSSPCSLCSGCNFISCRSTLLLLSLSLSLSSLILARSVAG